MADKSMKPLPMRIDIVTETWPPEINGVALTVHALARGLQARGHQLAVWRPRQPGEHDDGEAMTVNEHGWREYALPGLGLPRYPGLRFGLPAGRALSRGWRVDPPQAIYVATEGPLGRSAVQTAARRGIPAATGFHTRFDDFARHYGVGFLTSSVFSYLRRFHNRGDATLVPTRELQKQLTDAGFSHVRLLRRAVDTESFNPVHRDEALRAGWGVGPEEMVMLHVGRLAPEKNLELMMEAYVQLRARNPALKLVVVGDGPSRESLQNAHPEVIFSRVQRGEALSRHYASGDLFVFPSLTETFGNVTMEAMASGLGVVAFDYAAACEHIHNGDTGRTVAFADEEAFVDAVLDLGSSFDGCRAMGSRAFDSVRALTPDAVTEQFDALLTELVDAREAAA